MLQNGRFLEGNQIISAFDPVDMSAAANNGDWISLKNYGRVVVVLFKKAGTAGDDPVFTLKQATDTAGTGAKALNFTTVYSKVGDLTAAGQNSFTKVTQAAANTYTDATSAENPAILVVEILAQDLDADGGFNAVQLSVPDVGANAQIGCGFYLLLDPTFAVEPSVAAQ
jgi:hypothetical protein